MNNLNSFEQPAAITPVASGERLGARPPACLPSGKTNPEYVRWYRRLHPESVKNYNASEKRKACLKRFYEAEHDQNKVARKDECRCVECGMIFKRDDAILRGFRFLKYAGNRVVCDECA